MQAVSYYIVKENVPLKSLDMYIVHMSNKVGWLDTKPSDVQISYFQES